MSLIATCPARRGHPDIADSPCRRLHPLGPCLYCDALPTPITSESEMEWSRDLILYESGRLHGSDDSDLAFAGRPITSETMRIANDRLLGEMVAHERRLQAERRVCGVKGPRGYGTCIRARIEHRHEEERHGTLVPHHVDTNE